MIDIKNNPFNLMFQHQNKMEKNILICPKIKGYIL